MGLVNRVVPRDDLDATVDELAAHVARGAAVDAHGDQAAREARVGAHGHAHAPADVDRRDGRHREDTCDAHELRMEMAQRGLRPRQQAARDDAD